MKPRFIGQEELLSYIEETEPEYDYVSVPGEDEQFAYMIEEEPVTWLATGRYVLDVPVSNIQFMGENLWYLELAAALLEGIREGEIDRLQCPAGRAHRISKSDYEGSQEDWRNGELEEQLLMVRPWDKKDIGSYKIVLTDGNHRALAAMAAGAKSIPVYVSENYRNNVLKKDWLPLL